MDITKLAVCHYLGLLPLFSAPGCTGLLAGNALEDVQVDGLVLLEDDRGDVEVALQTFHLVAELLRQVGHVLPLLHLAEKLDHAGGRKTRNRTLRTSSSNQKIWCS